MKIRTDFVTNSSSSSFVFFGFYSKELLDYLQELIDGGFTYRFRGEETMSTKGVIASHTGENGKAIVDAMTLIPRGKNIFNKIGLNIEKEVTFDFDENDDAATAFLSFLNPDVMTFEQREEICARVEELVADAQKKGLVVKSDGIYNTDAPDFAEHFSVGDYDKAMFECNETGAIVGCKNKKMQEAHFYSRPSEITSGAFQNMKSLQLIFFHNDSPRTIFADTFAGCTSLESVKGLTCRYVEEKAFSGCTSLKNLDFLNAFIDVGTRAFEKCIHLEQVTFFGDATLSADAFSGCEKLKEVIFYGRKDKIPANLFADCPAITIIGYENAPAHKYALTYHLPFKNLDDPMLADCLHEDSDSGAVWFGTSIYRAVYDGFILNDRKMIVGYHAPTESLDGDPAQIVIPEGVRIAHGAFKNCTEIKTITAVISKYLGCGAFAYCGTLEQLCLKVDAWTDVLPSQLCEGAKSLHTVELPEGIYCINARAFYGCESLRNINIPDSVMYIDPTAFEGCDRLPQETWDKITALSDKAAFDENIAAAERYLQTSGYSACCFDQLSRGQLFRYKAYLELWHTLVDPYLDYPDTLPEGKEIYVVHAGRDVQIDMSKYGWTQQKTLSDKVNYLVIDTENIERFERYPRKHRAIAEGNARLARENGNPIEEIAIELKKSGHPIQIITKAHLDTCIAANAFSENVVGSTKAAQEKRQEQKQEREAKKAEERAERDAYIAELLLSMKDQCESTGIKYSTMADFWDDSRLRGLKLLWIEQHIQKHYQQKIEEYLMQKGMLMTDKERILAQIEEVLDILTQRYVGANKKAMSVRDLARENPDVDMRVITEHAAFYTGKTPRVLLTERGIIYSDEELQSKDTSVSQPKDPAQIPDNIRKRMDTLFAKLDEAYPDKVLVRLNQDHREWGRTVTELYRLLGYESPKAFLTAYGYIYANEGDKGGRPKKNPMEIIEELQRRYPNGTAFTTVDELKAANPDIASRFQSLRNKSNEYFGMPFTQYLRSIGLIK